MARSLAAQALHYFARPHDGDRREPVGGAAAWSGSELAAHPERWRHSLDEADRDEIVDAVGRARRLGKPTIRLTAADLPLPRFAVRLADWRAAVADGLGVVVICGVPVDRLSAAEIELFFWCFGLHLGVPGEQNTDGDLLGHVVDQHSALPFGSAAGPCDRRPVERTRLYETAEALRYHCDAADVVGLLCLRTAKEGGQSRIASSVTVFNTLLAEAPELAAELWRPCPLDSHGQRGIDYLPITPCRFAEGRLRTFYHGDYFRSGAVVAAATGAPVSARLGALLDHYDQIAHRPDVRLDMELEPGDIQLLSNHTVIHSRTRYVDHDDAAQRRHLLRLWLSLDGRYRGRARIDVIAAKARLLRQLASAWLRRRSS